MGIKKVIEELSDNYVSEAKNAPQLFQDMSAMEQYMAESYSSRVLVELIQNADDARASRVQMKQYENDLIFANNGVDFSEQDIKDISRAGNSSKKRGTSIGYRGVGFKSSTYVSDEIVICSKNTFFSFSKNYTSKILKTDKVPVVRIPFLVNKNSLSYELQLGIEELQAEGFSTFFIYKNAKINLMYEEVKNLSEDYLLFLNCIKEVNFQLKDESKIFHLEKQKLSENIEHINIIETENSWLILNNYDKQLSFGFKINENNDIVECNSKEALFHCFLPTLVPNSLPFKINADFPTDPSRKHIVSSENTEQILKDISDYLFQITSKSFLPVDLRIAIINLLCHKRGFSKFTEKILYYLKGSLKNDLKLKNKNGRSINILNILKQPDWLTSSEFSMIAQYTEVLNDHLPADSVFMLPFYNTMCKYDISLQDVTACLKDKMFVGKINPTTFCKFFACFISKAYKCFIFKHENVNFSGIFVKCGNGTPQVYKSFDSVEKPIIEETLSYLNNAEVKWLQENMGLELTKSVKQDEKILNKETKSFYINNYIDKGLSHFVKPLSMGWKDAEDKCVEFEKYSGNEAKNISKQNLGYDVISKTPEGKQRKIDVKKLAYSNAPFSLTNNEYTAAMQFENEYYLCLICESEDQIIFSYIKNPLENAKFEKRVQQWVWYSDEYQATDYYYKF